MENFYDVIVIGAGPAGGQIARELSKDNKVLLVDKFKEYYDHNFSTAGMTMKAVHEFNLPEKVIGRYWKNFAIQCSKRENRWESDEVQGAILDFAGLRKFLAEETIENGGTVLLGHQYMSKKLLDNAIEATFKKVETNESVTYRAKILVDATGPLRKVMYEHNEQQPKMMTATGLEYLIKVPQESYDRFKDDLFTFMGDKWALKGYSWICPMENRILKVGSGKLHLQPYQRETLDTTLKNINLNIIHDYMGIDKEDYEVLDIHGGPLRFSTKMEDLFYRDRVVAVGDCVSTVNPLGGEGVRYAMISASMASKYVAQFVKTGKNEFAKYEKKWKKGFAFKWRISEVVARKVYLKYSDEQISERAYFMQKNFTTDQLIDILFNFNYNRILLRTFNLLRFKLFGKL